MSLAKFFERIVVQFYARRVFEQLQSQDGLTPEQEAWVEEVGEEVFTE